MASSSGLINLDNLLTGNDNEEYGPIIKISHAVDSQSDREVESAGSDSSYGEFAKARARDMDRLISEARMEQEEKNRRITAARNQKVKEQEEKQKAFGKSSKKLPGKKSFFSKSLDGESIRKVKDNKSCKPIAKDAESVDNKNDSNIRTKRPRTKKTPLPVENKPTRSLKIILPSKLKNVTVQNFDIDSTPSSSSEEIDLQSYNKVIDSYQKSFKVKSLNRVVNEVDSCSSEDSDDENSQPIKQKFHHSGEKSAAAQRRKRSNYLKKRHSNFKPNKNETQQNDLSTDKTNVNQEIINSEPILRDKPLNPQRDKKNKKESIRQNQSGRSSNTYDSTEIQKSVKNSSQKKSRKTTVDMNAHTSKESNIKNDKINEISEVKTSDKTVGSSKEPIDKPKSYIGKNKKDYIRKDNQISNNKPIQGKQDITIESKKSKSKVESFNNPYSSSDDSIIVIKQIPINNDKVDDDSFVQFEKTLFNTENEIDWKSVEESRLKTSVSRPINKSEEEIEIDFKELVENRKAKTPLNVDIKQNKQDDSSSDFEAQFDVCLVKFKQLK